MGKRVDVVDMLLVTFVLILVISLLLSGWREQPGGSQRVRCLERLHELGKGFTMYGGDNGMWPYGATLSGKVWQWDGTAGKCFAALREKYVDSMDRFVCPAMVTEPVYSSGRFLSGLGYGYDAKDNERGTYVRNSAHPMRAIIADRNTDNHGDAANVMFADTHVVYLRAVRKNVVPNAYISGDTNIYQFDSVYTGNNPTGDPEPKGFTTDIDQNAAIRETY